jgi:hypothetical protein
METYQQVVLSMRKPGHHRFNAILAAPRDDAVPVNPKRFGQLGCPTDEIQLIQQREIEPCSAAQVSQCLPTSPSMEPACNEP